ncbi:hypothetical protein EK904_010493 [Melospiza melodia maxima]|nr:hypothetical protein EK904_010493 [Melospiza melodia maxima]
MRLSDKKAEISGPNVIPTMETLCAKARDRGWVCHHWAPHNEGHHFQEGQLLGKAAAFQFSSAPS